MRVFLCTMTLGLISGCMEPVAVSAEAIPFQQVRSLNADKPYECYDYDAQSDTCRALATYRDLGQGRYAGTVLFFIGPDLPLVETRAPSTANGNVFCTDMSEGTFRFANGYADEVAMGLLNFTEKAFQELDDACVTYHPSVDGYVLQDALGASSSDAPNPHITFFAGPKQLRVEEGL